jgi:HEAT repeat protein
MSEVDRIQKLLASESVETQIAAAIVLGELRVRQPSVTQALVKLLDSPLPVAQRHALEALGKIGTANKASERIFGLLRSNVEEVRRAAAAALGSIGQEVVPTIRARLAGASAEEKRALDAILAELGGKDAFSALLDGLANSTGDAAKAAAIAVRQRVKEAGARERSSYLAATEKYLRSLEPAPRKGKGKNAEPAPPPDAGVVAAKTAAVKILGYLEDERALGTLLGYATAGTEAPAVRQEAIIALRFVLAGRKVPPKLVDALGDAAESPDRTLAQTALHTLGMLELPAGTSSRVGKLLGHADLDRVRFVVDYLARQAGPDALKVLVGAACKLDRRRAELAAAPLEGRDDAAAPLAKALCEASDPDRAWLLRNALRVTAGKIPPATRRELLGLALERLGQGARGWEAPLDVARDADPEAVAVALRQLGHKLAKGGATDKARTVLELLCRSERATDEDRYALGALELGQSKLDPSASARAADPALARLGSLLGKGFDLGSALRKDRSLGLEQLYYVGFHWAEQGHPLGEELLGEVADKGGRSKLARMAKSKLELSR